MLKKRDLIVDAAADCLVPARLPEVTKLLLNRKQIALRAECVQGTVTYHFPDHVEAAGALAYEAIRRAMDRVGAGLPTDAPDLDAAARRLQDGDATGIVQIADALRRQVLYFSPDPGTPSEPIAESEEVAVFLAAAVAPYDEIAAEALRKYCRPMRKVYEEASNRLLKVTGRTWTNSDTGAEAFALLTGALCDGWIWLRRFDRDVAKTDIYVQGWMQLFEAATTPVAQPVDDLDFVDNLPPAVGPADPATVERVHRAVRAVCLQHGSHGLTLRAVQSRARVTVPVLRGIVGDELGLQTVAWSELCLTHLLQDAADEQVPPHRRLDRCIEGLVQAAVDHRMLVAGYLQATLAHDVGTRGGPDPRTLMAVTLDGVEHRLEELLTDLLVENQSLFRSELVDGRERCRSTSALIVTTALSTAVSRQDMTAEEIVGLLRHAFINDAPSSEAQKQPALT